MRPWARVRKPCAPLPHLGALRDELIARPAWADCLARGRAVRMALDQTMAQEATPLADGAEAAFFPPVTGG